ncbi:hypothetical protein CALK_0809 [Chitinivibrio alkaliphilus ACht1]|uniref:Uncharacterized protein n=1 Tax=Chitinivibrio alkaliphilus ACht1 TaxID=1313304 RepID=U7D6E4_9BACT|nr:hypothetical protein CALK_0809 [Chitinivibrio alkaliphilus ACht1]
MSIYSLLEQSTEVAPANDEEIDDSWGSSPSTEDTKK